MRRHDVSVASCEQFSIPLVACSECIVVDAAIELPAALHDLRILHPHLLEGLEDGLAVAGPIALVVAAHVLDVAHLVITEEHETPCLGGPAQVVDIDQRRRQRLLAFYRSVAHGVHPTLLGENAFHPLGVGQRHLAAESRQVEIAPVDGDEVALPFEHWLLHRATLEILHPATHHLLRYCGLVHLIDRELRRGGEIELHLMPLSIGGRHLIAQIVDRCGEQFKVVDEHGSGKDQVEPDRSATEGIISRRSHHIDTQLLGLRDRRFGCFDTLKQAEVGIGAPQRIVAMRRDDVPARFEQTHLLFGEAVLLAHDPRLTGGHNALPVDKEFEVVVVRELQPEVLFQISRGKVDGAAYIDIRMLLVPQVSAERILPHRAPCRLLHVPCRIVECRSGPVGRVLLLVRHPGRPALLCRRHGHHLLKQAVVFVAHEPIRLAIHPEQAVHGLLGIAPVARGPLVEPVER